MLVADRPKSPLAASGRLGEETLLLNSKIDLRHATARDHFDLLFFAFRDQWTGLFLDPVITATGHNPSWRYVCSV
jgi:hypothetical protein